jgi:hypothetical protein
MIDEASTSIKRLFSGSSALLVIASEAKQSIDQQERKQEWIASRSLSSGAHPRDPLARNDGGL